MKLSKDDVELFYRLYHSLFIYVNKKLGILRDLNSREDIKNFAIDKINKIREELYKHPEMIDSFVADNRWHFSLEELKIISSWKHFVKGKFLIFRYLKDYTIFLDMNEKPPKAYGVSALNSTFEELVGPYLPILVDAVLLPFNNKIIYDSIFSPYPFAFGGNMRRDFNDLYQEAKLRFGIITSLPFSEEKIAQSDYDKLRFYLRSERNRERYFEEILELIEKDEELLRLYHQEMGKIHTRTFGKRLREIGLTEGWFAILEGITIAGGLTRDEVELILQKIVPPEKRRFVYIFQLKGNKNI